MSPLLDWALDWVTVYGPWAILTMTFLETGFLFGFLIPAGPTIVFGSVLAVQGHFSLWWIFAFTALGGTLGDHLGFLWGRRAGRHVLEGGGRFGRTAARHWDHAEDLFGRHPIYAVSFARLISFVRTLMPFAAGTSKMSYRTFVVYDLIGVAGWSTAYVGVGYLAGEGWRRIVRPMALGWTAVFVVLGGVLWMLHRRRASQAGPTFPGGVDA